MDNEYIHFNFIYYNLSNLNKKLEEFVSLSDKLKYELKNDSQVENLKKSLSNLNDIVEDTYYNRGKDFENHVLELVKKNKVEINNLAPESGIFKNMCLLTGNNKVIVDFDIVYSNKEYDISKCIDVKCIFKTDFITEIYPIPPIFNVIECKKTLRMNEDELYDLIKVYKNLFVSENKQYINIFNKINQIKFEENFSKLIKKFCDYDDEFLKLIFFKCIPQYSTLDKVFINSETLNEDFFIINDSGFRTHTFIKIFDKLFSVIKLITHLNKLTLFYIYWTQNKYPKLGNLKFFFTGKNSSYYSNLFNIEKFKECITRYGKIFGNAIEFLWIDYDHSEISRTETKNSDYSIDQFLSYSKFYQNNKNIELENKITKISDNIVIVETDVNLIKISIGSLEGNIKVLKDDMEKIMNQNEKNTEDIKSALNGIKTSVDEMKTEMKTSFGEMKTSFGEMKTSFGEMKTVMEGIKTSIDEMSKSIKEMKNSLDNLIKFCAFSMMVMTILSFSNKFN